MLEHEELKLKCKIKTIIKEFKTITQTAKFLGVSRLNVYRRLSTNKLWDNLYFLKLKEKELLTSFIKKINYANVY